MNPETTPEPIGPLLEDDSPHVPSVRDVADMLMERFKELRSKRVKVQVRDLIYGYAEAYGKTESELGRELALRGAAKRRKKQRGKTAEKKPREKKEPRPRERGKKRKPNFIITPLHQRDAEMNQNSLLEGFYEAENEGDI